MKAIRKVILLTTGGTIEKTYDELEGSLDNRESVVRDSISSKLRMPYTQVEVHSLMAKDSLLMDEDDREHVSNSLGYFAQRNLPIVILHGTDTMDQTSAYCMNKAPSPSVPIIFTGAMRPLGLEGSDALQNISEAILGAKLLPPGYYVVFHNEVYNVPNVQKVHDKRTFGPKS